MSESFVYLCAFENGIEAHIVKGRLEAEGIPVELRNENIVQMNLFYSLAVGGVKLYVPESQVRFASEILNLVKNETPPSLSFAQCPNCSSNDIIRRLDWRQMVFAFLLIGLPLVFAKKRLFCRGCSHSWRD